MGDPAGVGPETILGAFPKLHGAVEITVFGDLGVMKRAAGTLSPGWEDAISLEPVTDLAPSEHRFGAPSAVCGAASYRYVMAALRAALDGKADALVTAPINKQWWMAAGHQYPGHTELLAEEAGVEEYAMMLAGPSLRVVPVTTHIPLSEVPKQLSADKIVSKIKITRRALRDWFGIDNPRIACSALNPHSGEGGLLGREEEEIIFPAIEIAAKDGIKVDGPLPADTLFSRRTDYDAIVCMYHDQALIPIKTLHPFEAVNLTMGLPFVRTSPGRGTAYDIAGKGIARPDGMIAAIETAVKIIRLKTEI